MKVSIPHTINYCWFGRNPLPKNALKCIASWKKYMPDYDIVEWNEDNFDVDSIAYTKEAYAARKYAFVSDYARFAILYKRGGVYFDTDVELLRSMDDILERGAFMGCEKNGRLTPGGSRQETDRNADHTESKIRVNAGLGMAAPSGLEIYRDVLDYYIDASFVRADGSYDLTTVVDRVTGILINHGLDDIAGIQTIEGITIYPEEYFNPMEFISKKLTVTDHTRSIHHYDASWHDGNWQIKRRVIGLLGEENVAKLVSMKRWVKEKMR